MLPKRFNTHARDTVVYSHIETPGKSQTTGFHFLMKFQQLVNQNITID